MHLFQHLTSLRVICSWPADDHPSNGDMHEVVKGKFFAFRGPTDDSHEHAHHRYSHSMGDYFDVFAAKGITAIVRLNSAEYDRQSVVKVGMRHVSC